MKIKVVGKAVVIQSLPAKDIQSLQIYKPEALVTKNEKDEPIFKVGYNTGAGNASKHGIMFNDVTADGKAQLTLVIPESVEDKKAYVTETYAAVFWKLQAAETQIEYQISVLKDQISTLDATVSYE